MTRGRIAMSVAALCALTTFAAMAAEPAPPPGLTPSDPGEYRQLPTLLPPVSGAFPTPVDLSTDFPPVGDQGPQASCGGWAVAYVRAYQLQRERRWSAATPDHQMSPSFIYNQVKVPENDGGCDSGIQLLSALKLVRESGDATLRSFDYVAADCSRKPTAAVLADARLYRLENWGTVQKSVGAFKAYIASGSPLLVALWIDRAFQSFYRTDAVYRATQGPVVGLHALAVVGYDDSKEGGAFLVQNSYGPAWGSHGYGWIAYDSLVAQANEAYYLEDRDPSLPPDVQSPPIAVAAAPVEAPLFVVARNMEFLGNVAIRAKKVVFLPGVVVRVRNGARLDIDADQIVAEGSSMIDGTGEPGTPGDNARTAGVEWISKNGDADYWPMKVAVATQANHPYRGAAGGDGGVGGRGATIVLSHKPVGGVVQVVVDGGPGGPGGNGAAGVLLKNGRNYYCNGCMFDVGGAPGHPGLKGAPGSYVAP